MQQRLTRTYTPLLFRLFLGNSALRQGNAALPCTDSSADSSKATRLFKRLPIVKFMLRPVIYVALLLTIGSQALAEDGEASVQEDAEVAVADDAAQESDAIQDNGDTPQKPLGAAKLWRYRDNQQQLIADEKKETSVWLNTEPEAGSEPFLGIWQQDHSGEPKGAVLILPDEGVPPSERTELLALHTYLSANGWSTLAITLPKPNQTPPPKRPPPPKISTNSNEEENNGDADGSGNAENVEDANPGNLNENGLKESDIVFDDGGEVETITQADDGSAADASASQEQEGNEQRDEKNNTEPETLESAELVEPIVNRRILAGINYLQSQSQFNNIIIAQGSSAARALNFIANLQTGDLQTASPPAGIRMRFPLRALVLVDAEHQLQELDELDILTVIGSLEIPVLDIYRKSHYQIDTVNREQLALERKKTAKRSGLPIYITRAVQATPVGLKGEPRQTRIIRGFLHRYAQGVEDEQ